MYIITFAGYGKIWTRRNWSKANEKCSKCLSCNHRNQLSHKTFHIWDIINLPINITASLVSHHIVSILLIKFKNHQFPESFAYNNFWVCKQDACTSCTNIGLGHAFIVKFSSALSPESRTEVRVAEGSLSFKPESWSAIRADNGKTTVVIESL